MEIPHDIELNQEWKAKRHPVLFAVFETFLPEFLMPLAVFSSAVALSVQADFSFSPAVSIIGFPLAFIALLALWIGGMLTLGLFLGQFHFVNSTFALISFTEFRASQLFIVPSLFLAKMLYTALKHGNMSYFARLFVLITSCFLIYRNSNVYVEGFSERFGFQGWFAHAVEFLVFLAIVRFDFSRDDDARNRDRRQVRTRGGARR